MSYEEDVLDETKTILLEDFQNPVNMWTTLNDPVMGGASYSRLEIADGVAKFTGRCAIVPSLQAPGFITMETGSQITDKPSKFPDISTCAAFSLELKSNVPYKGYRFSFGKAHAKGGRFAYGYKAPILHQELPAVGEFGTVVLPFDRFSKKWDDATGDIIVECRDDPSYCPTNEWLERMETMSLWGEGVEGSVDLEVKSISAIGCNVNASEAAVSPPLIQSKIHTIKSNPFYMWATGFVAIVLGILVFCCCCCLWDQRKSKSNAPDDHVLLTKGGETYDSIERFQDEPDNEDIELTS